MHESEVKVGDLVRITKESVYYNQNSPLIRNKVATIMHVFHEGSISLEFVEYDSGLNTGNGYCKSGHGWSVRHSDIESATPKDWNAIIGGN